MIGLRDLAKVISPSWLQTGVGEKTLYVCGLAMDALLEKLNQGVRMRMPGYGDPSALGYIGLDRLIPQGLSETTSAYALRLKFWLDDWQRAGSPRSVLQQALGFLTKSTPIVRTVDDSSNWNTYIPGDNPQTIGPSHYQFAGGNWNWDNEADPHPSSPTAWWRWWLIPFADLTVVGGAITNATNAAPIQITTSSAHGLSTGAQVYVDGVEGNLPANGFWTTTVINGTNLTLNGSGGGGAYVSGTGTLYSVGPNSWVGPGPVWGQSGATWGNPNVSWGFNKPSGAFATLRGIASLWKGAHSWCRWIVVSFSNSMFDPGQPSGGGINPDGTWGSWAKIVNGQYVPARSNNARYCDGVL